MFLASKSIHLLQPTVVARGRQLKAVLLLKTNNSTSQTNVPKVTPIEDKAIKPLSDVPSVRGPVPHQLLKRVRAEYHGIESAKFTDETLWIPIYQLPFIQSCRALIRFKVYFTIISLTACSYKISQFLTGQTDDLLKVSLLSSTTLIGLFIAGDFFRKLICQIYTTQDHEYIRFCRFSVFGRRLDMILPRSAVVPLTENNATRRKTFLIVATKMPENIDLQYDNYEFYDEYYNLTLAFGGVLDKERFEAALGRILSRKF